MAVDNVVRRPVNPDCLRVATFNIHGGYSQFFDPNLERVAQYVNAFAPMGLVMRGKDEQPFHLTSHFYNPEQSPIRDGSHCANALTKAFSISAEDV